MAALAPQIEVPRSLGVAAEAHPAAHQVANARRPLAHHQFHHLAVAEAGAGGQGVLHVKFVGIVHVQNGGNAPLGQIGIAFHGLLFGDHGHAADLGRPECKIEPGNTTADNHEIGLNVHGDSRSGIKTVPQPGGHGTVRGTRHDCGCDRRD